MSLFRCGGGNSFKGNYQKLFYYNSGNGGKATWSASKNYNFVIIKTYDWDGTKGKDNGTSYYSSKHDIGDYHWLVLKVKAGMTFTVDNTSSGANVRLEVWTAE